VSIMKKYAPGETISFRLPADTPQQVIDYLNDRKRVLERKFSSEMAPLFVEAVSKKLQDNSQEALSIPLPTDVSREQKEWLLNPNTRVLIGHLLYQMLKNPAKAVELETSPNTMEDDALSQIAFKTNPAIQRFAKNTFLDFDDDDDED
jgi:hypothetical protein